jgi:hypothetical protein
MTFKFNEATTKNYLYRHMNLKKIINSSGEFVTTKLGSFDHEYQSCDIEVTPNNVRLAGYHNGSSTVYRDVTTPRLSSKYDHLFATDVPSNTIASRALDGVGTTEYVQCFTINCHMSNRAYTVSYGTPSKSGVGLLPVYVEIAPWSEVILDEHFHSDVDNKICKIVYVLREGAKLTLNRANFDSKDNANFMLESRFIQHPGSSLTINTRSGDVPYLQDLYFVKTYQETTTKITGRYRVNKRESVHVITDVDHTGVNSTSDIDVKSVVDGSSRFTFSGDIKVRREAEGTDANLQNKNLQLSDTAVVVTEPNLDISTKEIACKHGCTISTIDPDQMYLLNARGVSPSHAKQILTESFLNEETIK